MIMQLGGQCSASASDDEPSGLTIPKFLQVLDMEEDVDAPRTKSVAPLPQRLAADDDMSDEENDEDKVPLARLRTAPAKPMHGSAPREPGKPAQQATGAVPVSAQVSECKAMIAHLQKLKQQKLEQEDYMGAHRDKLMIQEQEERLQLLRQQLDSMPTPARFCPAPGGAAQPHVRGPKRKRSQDPAGPPAGGNVAPLAPAPTAARAGQGALQPNEVSEEEMPEQGGSAGERAEEPESTEGSDSGKGEEAGQWRSCPGSPGLVELPSERPDRPPFPLPCEVFDRLYPYQRAGVAWMARIFQAQSGGILADEMGLGKTIQVCALLNGARKLGATHALLLLPVTLLDQWAREARIWCPGWPVYTYYGTPNMRARALRQVQRPEGGLLLTSYSMIGYTDDLFEVCVDDAPSLPRVHGKGRTKMRTKQNPGGPKPGKLRKLDDDDLEDGAASEEEAPEPEIPACGLPRSGATKAWDVVVCDEAHKMKSISTLLGKSLRQLQSSCRILLTGTPVQNALQDLWALMDFAQPGLLGNHATFVKTFSDPIERGSVCGAKVWAVELKKHLAAQLRALLGPYLLRRTKVGAGLVVIENEAIGDEIGAAPVPICDGSAESGAMEEDEGQAKKLPPKKETIVWLAPSDEQLAAYQKVLEKSEVIREACAKTKLGIEVFRAIGLLKRLCNHPMCLLPTPKPGAWADLLSECTREVAATDAKGDAGGEDQAVVPSEAAAESLAVLSASGSTAVETDDARAGRAAEMMLRKLPRNVDAIRQQSSKLRCLNVLLPALAARGHRTLVFCQSLKMLDLIQICCLRPNGLPCLRIDGQTDAQARAEKVAKFQNQQSRFKCMILTTNVGGVGLNLTGADRVILVDPSWNPATDAQAVDRAFRIGQDREVRVYRLVMSGLIEDKMFRLQVFKMGLTKTALEAGQQHSYFTAREIRALFEWTDPQVGETRRMLLEKHGEGRDEAIENAAEDDGSKEGWREAGPAVGLSDFSAVYGCVAQEEERDDACEAQVAEAKQRLGSADEKLQRMQEARKAADDKCESVTTELQEAVAVMEQLREKRAKTEEVLKGSRSEATQARRAEAAAQLRLEKATRARHSAQEQQLRAKQAREDAVRAAEAATNGTAESACNVRGVEEVFARAMMEAEGQIAAVDESGHAVGTGNVDAAVDHLRRALKALEKLQTSVEAVGMRQAELDAAEEEMAKSERSLSEAQVAFARLGDGENCGDTDSQAAAARRTAEVTVKNREKEKQRNEQALGKAQSKADAAREAVLSCAQGLTDAGVAFTDSFRKTESRPVKMDKVKEAQSSAKASFRLLAQSSKAGKQVREALGKAMAWRRKTQQKATAAMIAEAEADVWLAGAESEYMEASAEEEARRAQRAAKDAELSAAEAARGAAEAEEVETKRRRDDLKAAKPGVLEAARAARAAEKQANLERQSLHAECNEVEKAQLDLETAKNSAVQTLQSEEYDATQVQQAYKLKFKAE